MSDNDDSKDTQKDIQDAEKPAISSGGFANFNDQYFINLSKELPQYSSPSLKAYATGTNTSNSDGCFAFICDPHLTPRTNNAKAYQNITHSGLPKLIAYGRATMPDKTARYVFIYKDTLGQPLYQSNNGIAQGWKVDKIIETLLIPVVMTLNELQRAGMIHGNICATNIYDGGAKDPEKIKLGECLSVPASYNQHAVFEPIERAMAAPIGRGEGTIKDDLYALGVLLAFHARNFDPLKGKTEEEIISAKVVSGSYAALIGSSDRIASGISDLLRGLLVDSDLARWSLEDVMDWLDGRRPNIKQSIKMKKADRALQFDGTSFFYTRTLAHRLFKNSPDAITLIEGHALQHWIERSIGDQDTINRVEMAFKASEAGGKGIGYWDRTLPLISIALDPLAPLRYRTLSFHMNGLGNALAEAFIMKKGLNNFIDFLGGGILPFWLSIAADAHIDISGYSNLLDRLKAFLRQSDMVNGIERCLYFLNPSIHCLSPLVQDHFATDTTEYVLALDKVASKMSGSYPKKIIDKHAACFLISRDQKLVESHAFDLSSTDDFRYILANLNILSSIQRFNNLAPVPHLSKWIATLLPPVVARYHDTERQKKIQDGITAKAETGILHDLLSLVESQATIKEDQTKYRKAIRDYQALQLEKTAILKKMEKPKFFSERTGREWAATVSGVISALIILGFLMVHYSGGG